MLTPRGRGIVRVAPGTTRQRGSVGSVGGVVRRLSLVALDVSMLLARSVAALSAPQIRIPYGSCSRILSIEGSSEGRRAGLEARIAARERSKEAERSRAERKSRRFPLLLFTHLSLSLAQNSLSLLSFSSPPPPKHQQAPRLYPAEDVPKPLPRRSVAAPTKQRASVAPGRVVILLAGRFKGKRAVVVKHLPSGLLLVTGPFAVNGVPLRRVNSAYVIGTSTTVDVSKVDASKLEDATFKAAEEKAKKRTSTRGEGEAFFAEADAAAKANKKAISPEFVAAQKAVDGAIKLDDDLKGYLGATFSLSAGDRPHLLKF